MPSLHEIQGAMTRAIVDRDDAGASVHVVGDGIAPANRLAVYRNTFDATLTKALRLSFPAVDRLVGSEFFDGSAMAFVHEHPPTTAYLDEFGAAFPDFLARFEPASSLPYLGGVARLEWAVSRAIHAPDAAAVSITDLAACDPADHPRIRFEPHPSLSLVRAAYPVDVIWRAVLGEDDAALAAIDLASGPVALLVQRGADDIEVTRLDGQTWRFVSALSEGTPLGNALAACPRIDAPTILADLLAQGRFASFGLASPLNASEFLEIAP